MKTLLSFLACLFSLTVSAQMSFGPGVAMAQSAPAAAGGGSDYYYSSAGEAAANTQAFADWYWIGDDVVATTGGTIDKIGIKVKNTSVNTATFYVFLYKNTGSWVLHECDQLDLGTVDGWFDVTLSSGLAVANGTTVRVIYRPKDMENLSTVLFHYYGNTSGGYYNGNNQNTCATPGTPTWSDDYDFSVRIHVNH